MDSPILGLFALMERGSPGALSGNRANNRYTLGIAWIAAVYCGSFFKVFSFQRGLIPC